MSVCQQSYSNNSNGDGPAVLVTGPLCRTCHSFLAVAATITSTHFIYPQTDEKGCFDNGNFEYKYEYEYFTDEYGYRSHEYEYFVYEYETMSMSTLCTSMRL